MPSSQGWPRPSEKCKDGSTSTLQGYVTVAGGPKNYLLQGYCEITNAGDGMGKALDTGENEVYSSILIERIA